MDANDLKNYIAYTKSYTVNSNGDYVWTIKADAPTESTNYTFDVRSSETNKYLKDYYNYEVEMVKTIKSVSHKISDGKIIFTVVTNAGDYNRAKVTFADDLKGYIAYTKTYTVDGNGNYVWTIKADAPTETTSYAFDVRSSNNNAYLKDYYYYDV